MLHFYSTLNQYFECVSSTLPEALVCEETNPIGLLPMSSSANVLQFSNVILHINWIHLPKRMCMINIVNFVFPS